MPENLPGVYVAFTIVDGSITTIAAELPTCIIAPLYEVFRIKLATNSFDALNVASQQFAWPAKRLGSVVDLAGTRLGLIDSQRKNLAALPPKVYLLDSTLSRSPVADDSVGDQYLVVDQSGFSLSQGARSGKDRGTFSMWALELNGDQFLYNPEGGLSVIKATDRFDLTGLNVTVASGGTTTRVFVEEDITAELSTGVRVSENQAGSITVSTTPSATAGRVVVAMTGASNFVSAAPGLTAGDVAVTFSPLNNFDDLSGLVTAVTSVIDGITFPVSISTAEVMDWVARVDFYDTDATYTTLVQTSFHKVVSINTAVGTINLDSVIPAATDNDYVKVSILQAQVGFIESINSPLNTQLTVVVPNTFSDTRTLVDLYVTPASVSVYPLMNVYVDYRAMRSDLSNAALTAVSVSEFLQDTGHSSVDHSDVLGYAVQIAVLAQPNQRPVYYIPVDLEPDGDTGLPENFDYATAYAAALEAAESIAGYNIICFDQNRQVVKDALKTHIDSMGAEESFRRGFFQSKLPLGAVESASGQISPGQAPGGVAALVTSGNKVIRDPNISFVTEANVSAGTKVVVVKPAQYAGEYTATADTTDDVLVLDGPSWTLLKEFPVAGVVNVNTLTGNQVLSGAPAGSFLHVEAGDYVEVTVATIRYRFKVLSVNTAGTQLVCDDEVPGILSVTGTGNGSLVSIIRSWINPSVEYHISPLTRQARVDAAIAQKTLNGRRYSLFMDQAPTIELSNGVRVELAAENTMVAVAAKRSGLRSFDEISNLALGAGILSVRHGYNTLKRSQIKALAQAGIVFTAQQDRDAQPIIVDMLTSATGPTAGIVSQEEMVTANADWMGRTLKSTFVAPPGVQLPNITPRLLGVRAIQIDAILRRWVSDGRLVGYTIRKVEQALNNKRRTNICLTLVMVIAEKEIAFELNLEV
jgi:hypothetical protein